MLDQLSMRLLEAAPTITEEAVVGRLQVLASFSASVKKAVNKSGKMPVAGCKVRLECRTAALPLYGLSAQQPRCVMPAA